ncbi:MOP flippase family protein [Spirosoma sp. 209]|uniref:MOP flippase family protein n=1 Tax=Spirosoma sp. 209 TaxID=1955701 RepID=UPI00098D1D55|nr:MOP flippase family protein [Spirosoma sp. 209]
MSTVNKAINGGKWITSATVIATVCQFAQIAVLARLLDPSAFGIVSISTMIVNFFTIFTNVGFSNSIISRQESDRKVLSTLYLLNVSLGALMFVVIYFSSPLIIAYYKEPRLEKVIQLSSCYFLIVYVGQIYSFILQKELKFKSVALTDIIGTVVGTSVTVFLAYQEYEELSLIYGQLSMQLTKSAIQVQQGFRFFRPLLYMNLKSAREHLVYGMYNIGDGLLGFIQFNSDNIVIGGLLGVKILGYYTIAYQLAIYPVTKLNPIILQIAHPLLARMKENNEELKRSYLKILDIISYCNMPLLAGLFITADIVIPILYGPGWESSVDLVRIFVFLSFFSSMSHPLFILVFIKGKPKILFYLNLVTLLIKVPLLYGLGSYWGVTGIALAFLLATFINYVFSFLIAHRLIGSFYKPFFANIRLPVTFCLAMVCLILLYKTFIGNTGPVNAAMQIAIGGAVYGGLTLLYKLSFPEIMALRKAL